MSKIKVHTTDQPDCDITAFILSCNRLPLLEKTVKSFLHTKDLPTKIVIVDDSGCDHIFEHLVEQYGLFADIICFPENRGLWWAKDFMVSFCSTAYIFYVEEDWLFLKTGYLSKSKAILEKYRDIGSIDISWRTFEEEGLDSYDPTLIDDMFYYKKPWRISQYHLHWFLWQGSPNLKRREDLILLGRVESYYNEWNVDRKYYALGFRGVYLNDRYVLHIGDNHSIMVNKRKHEHTTPETLYPPELQERRLFPAFDYYALDQHALKVREGTDDFRRAKRVFVTCLLDIGRSSVDGRDFFEHYIGGLTKLIGIGQPLIIFVDDRYVGKVLQYTGGKPIMVIGHSIEAVRSKPYYSKVKEITEREEWLNQAQWIRSSVLTSADYVALTLHKLELIRHCSYIHWFKSAEYYWIDAGLCSSFNIEDLSQYDFNNVDCGNKFLITTFPYHVDKEIHGFAKAGYNELCGVVPNYVCRASFFGGDRDSIERLYELFYRFLDTSLEAGYLGTEESIFTALSILHGDLFQYFNMPNGSIRCYLETLRSIAQ